MRPRLVLLVLDGFCPRHCTPAISPNLISIQKTGAYAPNGGRAVLPSSTYPNHASLVTGLEPVSHGILANITFTADGTKPAQAIGARGMTFLDAAGAHGLRTGVAVGDPNILGVIGANRADWQWPPNGIVPEGTPLVRGYAENATTFRELQNMIANGSDVLLCQLDNSDGISHLFGPDSMEALAAHSAADRLVGELLGYLQQDGRWGETIACVLSDHSQIPTKHDQPAIDLPRRLSESGVVCEVIEEGSAALIRSNDLESCKRILIEVDGVSEIGTFSRGILYAYAEAGRGFSSRKPLSRGIHGGPETTPTICVASGGHPGLALLQAALQSSVPTSASIGPLLMTALGVSWGP